MGFQNIGPSHKFGARVVLLLQEKILKSSWCIKGIFVWCIRGFFPSSDESVPAVYVDWTRGPKFTEQPESTARAAFQQSVRQATFGLPPGDAPTAEELALHRQGVPMRTSPPWPHA